MDKRKIKKYLESRTETLIKDLNKAKNESDSDMEKEVSTRMSELNNFASYFGVKIDTKKNGF
jgi:hypothetical protein